MKNESKVLVKVGDIYDVQLAGKTWKLKVYAKNEGIRLLGSFPSGDLSDEDWNFIKKNLKPYNRNPINPNKF